MECATKLISMDLMLCTVGYQQAKLQVEGNELADFPFAPMLTCQASYSKRETNKLYLY